MSIDELEGEELADAVAIPMGLERGFGGYWTLPPGPNDAEGEREIVFEYRPDLHIAQAWELVEEMRKTRAVEVCSWNTDSWVCTYYVPGNRGQQQVTAPTAPVAICRAFLKAKGAGK